MPKIGFKHSEESKLKMSESRKGKKRPEFSESWCEKISAANKGKKRPRVTEIGCATCGETNPDLMVKDKRNHTGCARICKKCDSVKSRENHREAFLKRTYGITYAQLLDMYANQKGRCALCNEPVDLPARHISVIDHDHATGKVRGIIHQKCNLLLGHADDNVDLLELACSYLKKHK